MEVGVAGEQLTAEVAVSLRGAIFRPVLSVSAAHADTAAQAPWLSLPSTGSSSGVQGASEVCELYS